jgi:hypothetical protein
MHITTHTDIADGWPRARVNPGSGEPFAIIDLGRAGDLRLETLDDCDRLIRAAVDVKRRFEVALSGRKHPYKRDAADSYDSHCDTCGLLPRDGIHQDGSETGGQA